MRLLRPTRFLAVLLIWLLILQSAPRAIGRVESVTGVKPGEVSTPSTQGDTQTSVSNTYTDLGNIETITSVGSTGTRMWEFGYTSDGGFSQSEKLGQPLTVTDPAENVTAHMRYDARGNMISIQDALGNMTEANYNTQDDLTSVELPATGQSGGGQTTQTYTYRYTNGPLIQVKTYGEAGGSALRTVDYTLGEDGEVLAITGDTENVATTYDCAYKPLTFTDGASRTTTYEYYATGLPKTVYFPGWTSGNPDRILYNSYTRFGAPASITDGRGETITYSYDDEELQCTLVDFSSTNDQNITIDYDNLGRALAVDDLSGSVEWEYDDLGNPLVQSRAFDSFPAQDVEYSYYPDGSREEMSAAIGGTNYVWHYTYDERGFCTQMTSPAGTANYGYLDNGALASREILNTSSAAVSYSAYTYNEVGMLETLTNKASSGGSTRSSYDLSASNSYDGVFNMKACAATITGLSSLSGTIGWTHDAKERLTDEAVTSGSRSSGTVTGTNAYDGASNPTTLRGTSSISYNSNNQRSVSTGTWEYDGNGNPTKFRGRDCTYDLPGRMGTMRDGNNWSIGYKYGADGLMASRAKTIYIPSRNGEWTPITSSPTYYLHDGGEPMFELAIGSNFTTVSAINVRGPDGLIARKQGSNWIYYEFDQQGNVAQRRDSSGNLLTSSLYDAYGNETNNGGTPTDCFGYNAQWGYWFDRDTGLYLCQARWYDPVTARWVNRDPIGYAGGANLYGYCGGGPVGWSDPEGLSEIDSATHSQSFRATYELIREGIAPRGVMREWGRQFARVLSESRLRLSNHAWIRLTERYPDISQFLRLLKNGTVFRRGCELWVIANGRGMRIDESGNIITIVEIQSSKGMQAISALRDFVFSK